MAQKSLDELKKVLTQMMNEESEDFRSKNSDKKVHSFKVTVPSIIKQSLKELELRGAVTQEGNVFQSLINIVNTEVPKMVSAMFKDAKIYFGKNIKVTKAGDSKSFRLLLEPKQSIDVYAKIRSFKGKHQEKYLNKLIKKIDQLNKPGATGKSRGIRQLNEQQKNFLAIGHDEGSSIAEQRVEAAQNAFYQFGKVSDLKGFPELFEGLEILVARNNTEDKDIVRASLESSLANKQKGGGVEQDMVAQLKRDLEKVLAKLNATYWVNLKGSDSKLEKVRKRVLNPYSKVGSKSKKVRTNINNEKINDRNSKSARKPPKRKRITLAAPYIDKGVPKTGTKAKSNSTAGSLFSFVAMINKKLPQTVMKNMNFPSLENRSGRFAGSVKVQTAGVTNKGFPSFGYTYQKNPYQVFEVGQGEAPWSTAQRDPRRLIDRSIREVAAELALGRFYTRRL
tara:strand:+ start:42 stop:1394 length:1353 start_codon:yes stop_codon:yes gene_type:complete